MAGEVTGVHRNGPRPLVEVGVGGSVIRATHPHPFYVRGRGFTAAAELRSGDELRISDGSFTPVESVADRGDSATVFNIQVAGLHTYFVAYGDGQGAVLVHNDSGGFKGFDGMQSYSPEGREILEIIGSDVHNVSIDSMQKLINKGYAEAHWVNLAAGVQKITVDLPRADGTNDTVVFLFVSPWFVGQHYEVQGDVRHGTRAGAVAGEIEAQIRKNHEDVMLVRGATAKIQGGLFSLLGGPISAILGISQVSTGVTDLATRKEHESPTTWLATKGLEKAGLSPEDAEKWGSRVDTAAQILASFEGGWLKEPGAAQRPGRRTSGRWRNARQFKSQLVGHRD